MASVKEVLLRRFSKGVIPNELAEDRLEEHGLNPEDPRVVNNKEQAKNIDLTQASLIDFLISLPSQVRQFDYQITQQDAEALSDVRRRILSKWGITDKDGEESGFKDISNTH